MYACKDLSPIKRHVRKVYSHAFRATQTLLHDHGRFKKILPFFALGFMIVLVSVAASTLGADDGIPVLTGRDATSAFVVDVEGRCSELHLGVPEALLTWRIDTVEAKSSAYLADLVSSDEFRIDLSKFPEGLERNQYQSLNISRTEAMRVLETPESGKSDGPESLAIVLPNLAPGVYYRTRVLALTPDGWVASPKVHFMSPICAVDGLDEIEEGQR